MHECDLEDPTVSQSNIIFVIKLNKGGHVSFDLVMVLKENF